MTSNLNLEVGTLALNILNVDKDEMKEMVVEELAGKADADHTHKMADITDLSIDTSNLATKDELSGKADVDHTHLTFEKLQIGDDHVVTQILPNMYQALSVQRKLNGNIQESAIIMPMGIRLYDTSNNGVAIARQVIQIHDGSNITEVLPSGITVNDTPVSLEGHTHSEYALADHTHESLTIEKYNIQIKIDPRNQGIMVSYLNNGKIAGVAMIRPGEIMTSNGAGTSSTQILENTISILDRSNNRNLRILPNQITINNDPVVLKSELDALEARVAALETK